MNMRMIMGMDTPKKSVVKRTMPFQILKKEEDSVWSRKVKVFEEEFKTKLQDAVAVDSENGNRFSPEFYQQIIRFSEELYGTVNDFLIKAGARYEDEEIVDVCDEVEELESSYYGSDKYEYERLSQAKLECKEAIKASIADMRRNFEERMDDIVKDCKKFLSIMEDDIQQFSEEFSDSFDDYISLECESKAAAYIRDNKDDLADSRRIYEIYEGLNVSGTLEGYMKKLFEKPFTELSDVQRYFSMCTYDEDDEYFCYEIDDAISSLNEDTCKLYESACAELEKSMADLWQSALHDFAVGVGSNLVRMVQKI